MLRGASSSGSPNRNGQQTQESFHSEAAVCTWMYGWLGYPGLLMVPALLLHSTHNTAAGRVTRGTLPLQHDSPRTSSTSVRNARESSAYNLSTTFSPRSRQPASSVRFVSANPPRRSLPISSHRVGETRRSYSHHVSNTERLSVWTFFLVNTVLSCSARVS